MAMRKMRLKVLCIAGLLLVCGEWLTIRAWLGEWPTLEMQLMTAAWKGDTEEARALLNAGANPNAADHQPNGTALWIAAVSGHTETVKVLLDAGATPELRILGGSTALEAARTTGQTEVVKLLEQAGAKE